MLYSLIFKFKHCWPTPSEKETVSVWISYKRSARTDFILQCVNLWLYRILLIFVVIKEDYEDS